LAPAGGWPQLYAAVENGADAVYLGLSAFNARARAENFSIDDLAEAVGFCHLRGVRVFVTLNVLVFQNELQEVEHLIRSIASSGADAVIVQDVGVTDIVRHVAPNLRVHGSTQMTVTSGVHPPRVARLERREEEAK
jgi:U32 family peptidase